MVLPNVAAVLCVTMQDTAKWLSMVFREVSSPRNIPNLCHRNSVSHKQQTRRVLLRNIIAQTTTRVDSVLTVRVSVYVCVCDWHCVGCLRVCVCAVYALVRHGRQYKDQLLSSLVLLLLEIIPVRVPCVQTEQDLQGASAGFFDSQ